jgi:hypothetical protein
MTISLHHLTISGESVRNYDLYNKCLAVITWSQCHWPANQDNATASQTAEIDKHQKIPTHPHIWTSVSLHRSKSCRFTPNDWFPNTLQYIWLYMPCVLSSLALFGQLQFSVVNSKPEITAHDLQIWSPMEPLNFEWCKVVPPTYACWFVNRVVIAFVISCFLITLTNSEPPSIHVSTHLARPGTQGGTPVIRNSSMDPHWAPKPRSSHGMIS